MREKGLTIEEQIEQAATYVIIVGSDWLPYSFDKSLMSETQLRWAERVNVMAVKNIGEPFWCFLWALGGSNEHFPDPATYAGKDRYGIAVRVARDATRKARGRTCDTQSGKQHELSKDAREEWYFSPLAKDPQ